MARKVGRLSPAQVEKESRAGMHADGLGLYLLVSEAGTRSWIYRYMMNGRAREMGLGSTQLIGLKEARRRAVEAGRLRLDGIDPLEHRRAARAAVRLEAARAVTFKQAAAQYIAAKEAGWKNAKHAKQWVNTLQEYAFPVIGDLPVGDIDVALVTKLLRPIWTVKVETASRVRGRVESILDFCITNGWRVGPNPAAWRCKECNAPAVAARFGVSVSYVERSIRTVCVSLLYLQKEAGVELRAVTGPG
jgi:hypothetical protein